MTGRCLAFRVVRMSFLGILCMFAVTGPVWPGKADKHPNIIIILADDLGQGDLGIYGNTVIRTPHIDRVGRGGAVFTDFYASGNVCTPSRAGLLTGRYPIRSGLASIAVTEQAGWGLPSGEYTLAELLRDRGYRTGIIGKWGLGDAATSSPLDHGFDSFFGVPNSNDMPDFALYADRERVDGKPDRSTITESYTQAALAFIAEDPGRPFFLYLSHTYPHLPLYASDKFAGTSAAGRYGDVVEELDAGVGRLVDALKKHGLFENTLIIVSSDNGPFFEGDPGPGHGGKGSGWDGGYRVPFIASWPARITPGQVHNQIAMNIDILPTIAEVIDHDSQQLELDGRSLLSALRGRDEPVHDHLLFFIGEEIAAIREQDWKLVTHGYFRRTLVAFENLHQLDGFETSYNLLFNMKLDADERYSLADRHPDAVQRLTGKLDAARDQFDPLRGGPPEATFPQ